MIRTAPGAIAQCLANVQAGLYLHGLHTAICREPAAALSDRVMYNIWPAFLPRLDELCRAEKFERCEFEDPKQLHGPTAIANYRECVATCSMQIVPHESGIVEIDYDLFNPTFGLAPMVGHLIEVLTPGKTDPWRVRRGLIKRGMSIPLVQ